MVFDAGQVNILIS